MEEVDIKDKKITKEDINNQSVKKGAEYDFLVKTRYEQDTKQRRSLARWMVVVNSLWVVFIIVIVFLCGFKIMRLDSRVFCTLLATTTANIIGLAYIVLKGLFQQRK